MTSSRPHGGIQPPLKHARDLWRRQRSCGEDRRRVEQLQKDGALSLRASTMMSVSLPTVTTWVSDWAWLQHPEFAGEADWIGQTKLVSGRNPEKQTAFSSYKATEVEAGGSFGFSNIRNCYLQLLLLNYTRSRSGPHWVLEPKERAGQVVW